ncbi:unnamed protein product [Parajaminaea phylloscopi]
MGSEVGDVFYCGDPSLPHERLAGLWYDRVFEAALAYGYRPKSAPSPTTRLHIPTGVAATPWRRRVKEPDCSWMEPNAGRETPLLTALEVVYTNEDIASFERELTDWALAGVNAIGLKLLLPSTARTITQIRKQTSIVAVAQARHSRHKQVWRYGPQSDRVQFLQGTMSKHEGSLIVLPLAWFAMQTTGHQHVQPGQADMVAISCEHLVSMLAEDCWTVPEDDQESIFASWAQTCARAARDEILASRQLDDRAKTLLTRGL